MTCLRKEDSKISFLLIYAIGFYLEQKKQDIWKIFLFPIYPYFYCLVFLTSFSLQDSHIMFFCTHSVKPCIFL